MADEKKLTLVEAAQEEALGRPVIGGDTSTPRGHELDMELNASKIAKARADLAAGSINVEQFQRITGLSS